MVNHRLIFYFMSIMCEIAVLKCVSVFVQLDIRKKSQLVEYSHGVGLMVQNLEIWMWCCASKLIPSDIVIYTCQPDIIFCPTEHQLLCQSFLRHCTVVKSTNFPYNDYDAKDDSQFKYIYAFFMFEILFLSWTSVQILLNTLSSLKNNFFSYTRYNPQ